VGRVQDLTAILQAVKDTGTPATLFTLPERLQALSQDMARGHEHARVVADRLQMLTEAVVRSREGR
jgi:hypothetical protein